MTRRFGLVWFSSEGIRIVGSRTRAFTLHPHSTLDDVVDDDDDDDDVDDDDDETDDGEDEDENASVETGVFARETAIVAVGASATAGDE
jgi:hypothetical protein